MEYQTGAFFVEKEESDVQGFAIIETSEGGPELGEPSYRVAEKWNRPESEGGPAWLTYVIPEELLLARIERGECAYTKQMSNTQLNGVENLVEKRVAETNAAVA